MCEIAESYAEQVHSAAKGLCSEVPVYIGDITITDFIAGPIWWNAAQAKRQRELIAQVLGLADVVFHR